MGKQADAYEAELKLWIGERIKALRHEYNLSQTQLADRAGLAQTRIAEAEDGKWGHTTKSLAKLLVALDITPSHFFTGAPHPSLKRRTKTNGSRVPSTHY